MSQTCRLETHTVDGLTFNVPVLTYSRVVSGSTGGHNFAVGTESLPASSLSNSAAHRTPQFEQGGYVQHAK